MARRRRKSGREQARRPETGRGPAGSPRLLLASCILLAAATVAVYLPVRHHGAVGFDDPRYVTENERVLEGVSVQGVGWAFGSTHAYNWHPLTWLSHMLDVELFGNDLGRHHLSSVVLHAASASLLLALLVWTTGALWPSLFVAGVFALHPLHVESVAWLSERKDTLSGLLFFLTLTAWVHYARRPGAGRYLLALACFVAGLLAKPMLVTVPFVLLLFDLWPLRRLRTTARLRIVDEDLTNTLRVPSATPRRVLIEKIPLLILSACVAAITVVAQRGVVQTLESFPLDIRVANAAIAYVRYLQKSLWPTDLAIFYPHTQASLSAPGVWTAAALLLFMTALVVASRRGYAVVGWLWYLGMLVPVIGFVQVGIQGWADRYTYLPMVGSSILVAWGLGELAQRALPATFSRRLSAAVTVAVLILLGIGARAQVHHWRDDETLFSHAAEVTHDNFWAYYNLGLTHMLEGDSEEAIAAFRQAERIAPDDVETLRNLGALLREKGEDEAAFAYFEHAVQLRPNDPFALADLARAHVEGGRPAEALPLVERARELRPGLFDVHLVLGTALVQLDQLEPARRALLDALELRPTSPEAHNVLGVTLARGGELQRAVEHFRRAVQLRPDYPEARRNLDGALSLLQTGD